MVSEGAALTVEDALHLLDKGPEGTVPSKVEDKKQEEVVKTPEVSKESESKPEEAKKGYSHTTIL